MLETRGKRTTLRYDFGKIEVYDHYVVAIFKEGFNVTIGHSEVLEKISEDYFPTKPFGYISHRINSYSVDPRVYTEVSKISNFVAFAIVSENPISFSNAEIERIFLKRPFRSFKKMDKAIKWMLSEVFED